MANVKAIAIRLEDGTTKLLDPKDVAVLYDDGKSEPVTSALATDSKGKPTFQTFGP